MLYFSNFLKQPDTVSGFVSHYSYVFSDKSEWERFQNNSAYFTCSLSKRRGIHAPGVLFTFTVRKEGDNVYMPYIYKGHETQIPLTRGDAAPTLQEACNTCLAMFADFVSFHKVDEHGSVTFEPNKFPFPN